MQQDYVNTNDVCGIYMNAVSFILVSEECISSRHIRIEKNVGTCLYSRYSIRVYIPLTCLVVLKTS
jgi:hypothetical protein